LRNQLEALGVDRYDGVWRRVLVDSGLDRISKRMKRMHNKNFMRTHSLPSA